MMMANVPSNPAHSAVPNRLNRRARLADARRGTFPEVIAERPVFFPPLHAVAPWYAMVRAPFSDPVCSVSKLTAQDDWVEIRRFNRWVKVPKGRPQPNGPPVVDFPSPA